jgi:hypothetical protein
MLRKPALGALAALLLGAAAAQASEATTVADRAGFLLGHAQRCGVAEDRLERAAAYSKELIAAFAVDDDDRQAAQTEFAERVLASALAAALGDPLPSCGVVKARLAELERHRQLAASQSGNGERSMADNGRSDEGPPRAERREAAKAAKPARRVTTKPEALTAEQRTQLALKRAARQMRGRPPSI